MGFMAELGIASLCPMLPRHRVARGRIVDDIIPRFGMYLFAHFNVVTDPWGHLTHSKAKRVGLVRVLCNAQSKPSPVPDEAIKVINDYQPEEIVRIEPHHYSPGEACVLTIAGHRRECVFVGYSGNRAFVRTWILGADRVTEVSVSELELLDNSSNLAATSAA